MSEATGAKPRTIKLALGFVIFLLFILAFEITAGLYVYYGLGIKRADYSDQYRNNADLNIITWMLRYTPHPYFGYEKKAIQDFERKNFVNSKEFVVGILGGSVAKSLGKHLEKNTEYFDGIRSFVPNLGSKNIVIANLAVGGGKQPQQFFMSAYFMDKLDMIINVDGFNDASPDHFLPAYPLEFPITSLKYLERSKGGQIYARTAGFVRWIYILSHELPISYPRPLASSSLYFAFWRFVHPKLFDLINLLQNKFYVEATHSENGKSISPKYIIDKRVDIWKKYTIMQFRLISSTPKKQVFFFVQPNQYLKGSKIFSKKEEDVAIKSSIKTIKNHLMENLLEGHYDLDRKGVPIFDLTKIFEKTHDVVYIDSCCHLNSLGNHLMVKEIVQQIKNYYQGYEASQ